MPLMEGGPRDSGVEGTGEMELGDLLPSAPSCGPPGLSPVLCALVLGLLGFCGPSVLIPARVFCHMASVFCGLKCCLSQRFLTPGAITRWWVSGVPAFPQMVRSVGGRCVLFKCSHTASAACFVHPVVWFLLSPCQNKDQIYPTFDIYRISCSTVLLCSQRVSSFLHKIMLHVVSPCGPAQELDIGVRGPVCFS